MSIFRALQRWAVGIGRFYYEGFREMTVGKTLWLVILIKLFVIFAVLRLFFFHDFLKNNFDDDRSRAEYVRHELSSR